MSIAMTERISKLLALASENGNENEAHNAILLAQRLMAEEGLTEADIAQHKKKDVHVVVMEVERTGRKISWHSSLLNTLSTNFRCYSYTLHPDRSRGILNRLYLMGNEADVRLVRMMYDDMIRIGDFLAKDYRKKHPWVHGNLVRDEFLTGFVDGLWAKLKKQKEENEQYALVLVMEPKVQDAVDEAKDIFHLKDMKALKKHNYLSMARSDGFREGFSQAPDAKKLGGGGEK